MLFKSQSGIKYLQGSFITPAEIARIISNPPAGNNESDKLKIREPKAAADGATISNNAATGEDNKELANVIFWVLSQKSISTRQIQQQFRMGNRAAEVMDELYRLSLVSAKFANQPRTVIPTCYENLSAEVVTLLNRHGYTEEQIREAFNSKC